MLPRQVLPRGAVLVLIAVLYHSALGTLSRFFVSLSDEYPSARASVIFHFFFKLTKLATSSMRVN